MPEEAEVEEPDMIEPDLDVNMVNQVMQNGAPEIAARHAVFNSGGNVEEAILWFY